jgi:plasmid maintenance system antidote protein VapI
MAVRLARATGSGVNYWMELPVYEVVQWLLELAKQLEEEHEARKKG